MKRVLRPLFILPAFFIALIAGVSLIHSLMVPNGIGTVPSIVSFTATPPVAKAGEPVTLAWNARGADSLTLEWSTNDQQAAAEPERRQLPDSGRIVVHPKTDTVYTLTCETAHGPMCSTGLTVHAE